MFKQFLVVAMTVLLSVSASAQTKKKKVIRKKPTAAKTAPAKHAPAADSTLPETAPSAEVEATPAPEAEPVAEAAPAKASASGKISQMNWQPADGQASVDLALGYNMYTLTTKVGGTEAMKFDATGLLMGLGFSYGFSAMNSVGVSTAYSSWSYKTKITGTGSDTTSKASGVGDIYINSRNYADMGGSKLLYGVSLGFSPGKKKTASPTQDGNTYSGGLSLPIYVGWEADLGGGAWGLLLSYDLKMERTTEGTTADTKVTGGNIMDLKAYYESGVESYWNAYLGYRSIGDSESKVGAAAATTTKGKSGVLLGASWGTHLSPGMLLALHYDGIYYSKYDAAAGAENDAYLDSTVSARARWEF